MMFQRTEPDEILKKIHDEERKQGRGYLKIFSGLACGSTYPTTTSTPRLFAV